MPTSSLTAAATRPRSLTSISEASILNGGRTEEETPGQGIDLIEKLRKPEKIDLTPLHCNIPVYLNNALKRCMKQGIEKTSIVVEALTGVLGPYIDENERPK